MLAFILLLLLRWGEGTQENARAGKSSCNKLPHILRSAGKVN